MSLASARGRGSTCGPWLTTLLLAAASSAGAGCQPPWLALDAGVEHSRWQETGSLGRTLVTETGFLRGVSLSVGARCEGFDGVFRVLQASGNRAYDGVTSTHAPIRTHSMVEQTGVELQGFVPLGAHWSGAGRAALRRVDREIIGVGRVQGYPERFVNAEVGVGARFATAPSAAWNWTATAWMGVGPPGRLDLRLPGADPAKLQLGASRTLELDLQAQGAMAAPGWHWRVRLVHRQEDWRAGEPQAIGRQGVPVAGAVQPATRQSAWRLQAGLGVDF